LYLGALAPCYWLRASTGDCGRLLFATLFG
jgi:hypothetical protein